MYLEGLAWYLTDGKCPQTSGCEDRLEGTLGACDEGKGMGLGSDPGSPTGQGVAAAHWPVCPPMLYPPHVMDGGQERAQSPRSPGRCYCYHARECACCQLGALHGHVALGGRLLNPSESWG